MMHEMEYGVGEKSYLIPGKKTSRQIRQDDPRKCILCAPVPVAFDYDWLPWPF